MTVTFPRSEPVVTDDGTFVRTDTWTQEGTVVETQADGRLVVEWDDQFWGPARATFRPDEVEVSVQ